jgi:hypothetical protein
MDNRKLMFGLITALLLLPAIPYVVAAKSITLETNSRFYNPGDEVVIMGTSTAGAGVDVYISVNNTEGEVYSATMEIGSDGKFEKIYVLSDTADLGVYKVGANDGANKAKTTFTVTNITPDDLADNMIKLAEDAKLRADKLFQQLDDQGVTILPEAQLEYDEGVAKLNEAKQLLEDDEPWAAAAAARDSAMNFRDAMHDAWKSAKVGRVKDKMELVIKSAIHRGLNLIEKLNGTIVKLEAEDEVVANAMEALEDAKAELVAASVNLEDGELEDAQDHVDDAKAFLIDVLEYLKPIAEERAHEGILKFLKGAEERINNLEAQLKHMRNEKNGKGIDAALGKMEAARGRIKQAEKWLERGGDLDALGELGWAKHDIDEGVDDSDSENPPATLRDINILQARIQFLERTEKQMQKWGLDTSAIQAQIDELKAQLEELMATP